MPDADFAILNTKIFRSEWFPGPINEEQFFNMLPFTNQITTFTMTGSDLVKSLNEVRDIFFPVWNLQPIFQNFRAKLTTAIIMPQLLGNGTQI